MFHLQPCSSMYSSMQAMVAGSYFLKLSHAQMLISSAPSWPPEKHSCTHFFRLAWLQICVRVGRCVSGWAGVCQGQKVCVRVRKCGSRQESTPQGGKSMSTENTSLQGVRGCLPSSWVLNTKCLFYKIQCLCFIMSSQVCQYCEPVGAELVHVVQCKCTGCL